MTIQRNRDTSVKVITKISTYFVFVLGKLLEMSSILDKNTVSELSIWASTPPMPIKAKPFDLILYRSLTDVAHTEIKLNFHIFTNAKIETVGIQIFIAQNLHFIVCKYSFQPSHKLKYFHLADGAGPAFCCRAQPGTHAESVRVAWR